MSESKIELVMVSFGYTRLEAIQHIKKLIMINLQCLEDRRWNDEDLLEAWSNGMKVDESNSLNYEQWLEEYKKNKQHH